MSGGGGGGRRSPPRLRSGGGAGRGQPSSVEGHHPCVLGTLFMGSGEPRLADPAVDEGTNREEEFPSSLMMDEELELESANASTGTGIPLDLSSIQCDVNHAAMDKADAGSLIDVNISVDDDCMVTHSSMDALSSPPHRSTNFCMGVGSGSGFASSIPVAFRTRSQGVRLNAPMVSKVQNQTWGGLAEPLNTGDSAAHVWRKPPVVPIPSMVELGRFSEDGETAMLDDEEVDATSKKFESALVGRMFGRRIPYIQLANELNRRWIAFGVFRLVSLGGDCFVCFFDNVEARDAVLMGGPWVLFGQVVGIDHWTPAFSPKSSEGFCTPVWIRMPGLPLYCWSSKNIGRIAALVGEPLWLDSATDRLERGLYARVCIRIDLSKPLKPGVWVEGRHGRFFQALEYEGLSVFCCRCSQVGHKESSCKLPAARKVMKGSSVTDSTAPNSALPLAIENVEGAGLVLPCSAQGGGSPPNAGIDEVTSVDVDSEDCRGVGPWMMVTRKKRPIKGQAVSHQKIGGTSKPGDRAGSKSHSSGNHPPRLRSSPSGSDKACHTPSLPSLADQAGLQQGGMSHGIQAIEDAQPPFSGFMAMPTGGKERMCKSFLEKMVSDLGPVAYGTRKKRKHLLHNDGGDASSFKPA